MKQTIQLLIFILLATQFIGCKNTGTATTPVSIRESHKLSGGGDLNTDLEFPYDAQQKFLDNKIGLSIHWGPSSLGGKEIGWSRHFEIEKEVYDNFYKDFNPTRFDAQKWCELFKRWGIRYLAPTSKHHDGFALWFTKYSPYDMEATPYKVDIMKELQKACKVNDISFGAYYSILDWHHPDWTPNERGGAGTIIAAQSDSPNLDRYYKYMEDQVMELIEDYDVEFLQFDGEWDSTYTHEIGSDFYRKFRNANPNVLISSRLDIGRRPDGITHHNLDMDGKKFAGDYLERERLTNHGNNVTEWFDDAWQAWVTIDRTQWAYNPTPDLMSAEEMIEDMIGVIGNNGNYMINVAPTPEGWFVDEQIELMDELGAWILDHSEAIYGTRGGPYYPYEEGVSTRKGNKAWLFITDRECTELSLPILKQALKQAKLYNTSTPVEFQVQEPSDCKNQDQMIHFILPPAKNHEIRLIELTFDAPVEMEPMDTKASKDSKDPKAERNSKASKDAKDSSENLVYSSK